VPPFFDGAVTKKGGTLAKNHVGGWGVGSGQRREESKDYGRARIWNNNDKKQPSRHRQGAAKSNLGYLTRSKAGTTKDLTSSDGGGVNRVYFSKCL